MVVEFLISLTGLSAEVLVILLMIAVKEVRQ